MRLLLLRIDAQCLLVDQGASTTGAYADAKSSPSSLRIRKVTNRFCESARVVIGAMLNLRPASLAKLMVYSMAVDAPVRSEASPSPGERRFPSRQVGYLAGSKSMESLDKFITSTESFFHPSNSGLWSLSVRQNIVFFCLRTNHWHPQLTQFLRSLTSEFCKRWHEEELSSCKTPLVRFHLSL